MQKRLLDYLTGDRRYDVYKANERSNLNKTPLGRSWHHVEDGRTMQLVPEDLHSAVPHSGGVEKIKEVYKVSHEKNVSGRKN